LRESPTIWKTLCFTIGSPDVIPRQRRSISGLRSSDRMPTHAATLQAYLGTN